jgi:hypothetical protein
MTQPPPSKPTSSIGSNSAAILHHLNSERHLKHVTILQRISFALALAQGINLPGTLISMPDKRDLLQTIGMGGALGGLLGPLAGIASDGEFGKGAIISTCLGGMAFTRFLQMLTNTTQSEKLAQTVDVAGTAIAMALAKACLYDDIGVSSNAIAKSSVKIALSGILGASLGPVVGGMITNTTHSPRMTQFMTMALYFGSAVAARVLIEDAVVDPAVVNGTKPIVKSLNDNDNNNNSSSLLLSLTPFSFLRLFSDVKKSNLLLITFLNAATSNLVILNTIEKLAEENWGPLFSKSVTSQFTVGSICGNLISYALVNEIGTRAQTSLGNRSKSILALLLFLSSRDRVSPNILSVLTMLLVIASTRGFHESESLIIQQEQNSKPTPRTGETCIALENWKSVGHLFGAFVMESLRQRYHARAPLVWVAFVSVVVELLMEETNNKN